MAKIKIKKVRDDGFAKAMREMIDDAVLDTAIEEGLRLVAKRKEYEKKIRQNKYLWGVMMVAVFINVMMFFYQII